MWKDDLTGRANQPEQAVQELIELGFEIRLKELSERDRRAECSFGYLAQAMGMTTWELTHLLEEGGRVAHSQSAQLEVERYRHNQTHDLCNGGCCEICTQHRGRNVTPTR